MRQFSRIIILTILVLTLSSCATEQVKRNPEEVLNSAISGKENNKVSYGTIVTDTSSDLPYIPIMKQPEIERVWIYTHVTPSYDLVTGHWVFIILNDRHWHIDTTAGGAISNMKSANKIPIPPK